MWIPLRTRLAIAILVIGAGLSAWLFLGVQVGRCLGPLGVTIVRGLRGPAGSRPGVAG